MPSAPKSVVAILPARWGSTRFPGKPLYRIAGKLLIQHVWERTLRAKSISRVIVATDDMRIAEAAFGFGAEVSITSPKHRSGTDRIAEVAQKLKGASHVLNVQGDEPLVDPTLLNRLAKTLLADPKLDMVTAANAFAPSDDVHNPNAVKVVLDQAGNALYFSRSPIPYVRDVCNALPFYRHQGLYGYSLKFLLQFVKWKPSPLEKAEQLEQLRAMENGARIRVLITKHASVGVDVPADVAAVEKILSLPASKRLKSA
ncbi:MAG: 3-deoxy-manno-octulosonate cytidylyltransferase [Verrucomicrobia bacterium]|nr:3-deoxy-manno-octulosonate cytidylyltransferase [Verrucomicrobiota bacterium]